ncbi:MAG TPA: hypothetical protein VNU49_06810 [Opitutaceae bacterium]|nr:hypothetical protein [Opitutaceae bacterium]
MDPGCFLSGNERKAWDAFFAGVDCLQDQGDRKQAAGFFEQVAKEYPESKYAKDSKELAGLLRQMVEEDKQWTEPRDVAALPIERKVAYYIYHLRDVKCYQLGSPGFCSVLNDFDQRRGVPNAAMKLKEIGEPAIPALIQLLDDRRPTRSIGYWRIYMPSRTVLRYQDAAIEILGALLPASFYNRSSSAAYFSTESIEVRQRAIGSIKDWYQSSLGKTEVEKEWLAVAAAPGIYEQMGLLEDLALAHGQKDQVLSTLRQMCVQKDPLQLPQISWVMCEFGDYSEVGIVEQAYISGQYDVGTSLPDDSAAGSNAGDYTLRQVILYGTDSQREAILRNAQRQNDPLDKGGSLFGMLVNTADEEFGGLPKTYDRSRFPLKMLVDVLTDKQKCGGGSDGLHHWTIRRCDQAAKAIQKFTGKPFGYDETTSDAEKDEAIGKILKWWKALPTGEHIHGKT